MTEKAKKPAPVWLTDGSDNEDIEVKLIFERKGMEYELVHLFHEPTAADKRAHMKHLSRTKVQRKNRNYVETDYLGANELLYDRCIISVQGYDVDASSPGWKGRIPPDHKNLAVGQLLNESGMQIDDDEAKN